MALLLLPAMKVYGRERERQAGGQLCCATVDLPYMAH